MSTWSYANNDGDIVIVDDVDDMNRAVGNCWMKGRLKEKDVLMCVAHSGDGFHNWILLDCTSSNCIKAIANSQFGAYGYSRSEVIINSKQVLDVYKKDDGGGYMYNQDEVDRIRNAIVEFEINKVMNS